MTSVLGHLTGLDFPPEYKDWRHPPPARLFDAPVHVFIPDVRLSLPCFICVLTRKFRIRKLLPRTSKHKLGRPKRCLSGQIVIEKANISAARFALRP
jgi:hypothetical protein